MAALTLAHIGHWTTSLAFFGPVLVLPTGLYAVLLIERRRGGDGGEAPAELPVEVPPS